MRTFRLIFTAASAFLIFQFVSLYLAWPKQILLGAVTVLIAVVLNRVSKSMLVTIGLMFISMASTFRYGWWRIHTVIDYISDPSKPRLSIDTAFLFLLLSAEVYTVIIMVLGYMQTVYPLGRKPIVLPNDESEWPHVDVLIPTYNEALSLVRYTALAAINIDYPPEKLHVYILDDGTRADFKAFAEAANVGYITRVEHKHAKAGNINHALTKMDSPFIAIFDCDHVPTRSYLQMTLGWLIADKNLAMLQTPHHFYSPDPFERNLLQYKSIPNEGELFYGMVQDGNDLWNATFFCGSCAVIRRTALEEVGGIAVETVTEDAHTSLRMQKRGWGTAYINIAQAAGLATDTLTAHVGQRVRWARGMIQILRTDNPLLPIFGGKMKFTQRLCYFNAMLHFMYAVPRLVFLFSPLVYMLAGRVILPGYWVAILAYSMPHLLLSSMTNSRVQGRHRHSFWNEIYETVLAPYILMPTVLALINPKLGSFNVTDKGSTLAKTKFDRRIAAPVAWMLFFNLLGVLAAPYRMFIKDPQHKGTVALNLVWIVFNMVILGVAAAVAYEQKQQRTSVRILTDLLIHIKLPGDKVAVGRTMDMSVGGAAVNTSDAASFKKGDTLRVKFPEQTGEEEIGATVVRVGSEGIQVRFELPTIAEQETLTRALYSRADTWIKNTNEMEVDRPLISLLRVCRLSLTGLYEITRGMFQGTDVEEAVKSGAKSGMRSSAVVLLCLALMAGHLLGQVKKYSPPFVPSTRNNAAPSANATTSNKPAAPVVTANTTASAIASGDGPPVETHAAYEQIIGFKDMGLQNAIGMTGPHSYNSVHFILPYTALPKSATLKLMYKFDPALTAKFASIKVMLNDTVFATVTPPETPVGTGEFTTVMLTVPPELLQRQNAITFEFTGSDVLQSASQVSTQVLAQVSEMSQIDVAGDVIPFHNDMSLLPLPFFDAELQTPTSVPFVFLTPPDAKMLQAAGAVASWFGILSSTVPVRFTVSIGKIPMGNAIIFGSASDPQLAAMQIPADGGGVLALRSNPADAKGSLLVVAGGSEDAVLAAAQLLAQRHAAAGIDANSRGPVQGDTLRVANAVLPAMRQSDDAPRWLPTSKMVPLGDFTTPQAMQSDGSQPVLIYFRVPPDMYYGENQNLQLHLGYRYNAAPLLDGSMLRVYLNGHLVTEIPLLPGADFNDHDRWVVVPVEYMRPSSNTLKFSYDFVLKQQAGTVQPFGSILPESSLDVTGLAHWTRMPNLELFANAGYPFTQWADLAQTTVVLPSVPSAEEIGLYLLLMGHCGAQTGMPTLRVTVAGPEVQIAKDRDYLVLGTVADQPAFGALDASLPVSYDNNGIHVKQAETVMSPVERTWNQWLQWSSQFGIGTQGTTETPSNNGGAPEVMVEGLQSPDAPGRSIVLVELKDNAAATKFADVFLPRSQSSDIHGSVSLLRANKFTSYEPASKIYFIGNITWYAQMRIWMTQYYGLLLVVVILLILILARWVRESLLHRAAVRLELEHTNS